MKINTDINILGGLPDWSIVQVFLNEVYDLEPQTSNVNNFSAIKTARSVKRFKKSILNTLIKFENTDIESLIRVFISNEGVSDDFLILLFWNASNNNDLLHYLNRMVYFEAFYSGRVFLKQNEAAACLKELREDNSELKKWSDYTLNKTASKYLTLLKKVHLMEGSLNKTILHPYLNDKLFIHFVYWLASVEPKSNLLESDRLKYSFVERSVFIERLTQKRFLKYYKFRYTGESLKIETTIPYDNLYHAIT